MLVVFFWCAANGKVEARFVGQSVPNGCYVLAAWSSANGWDFGGRRPTKGDLDELEAARQALDFHVPPPV